MPPQTKERRRNASCRSGTHVRASLRCCAWHRPRWAWRTRHTRWTAVSRDSVRRRDAQRRAARRRRRRPRRALARRRVHQPRRAACRRCSTIRSRTRCGSNRRPRDGRRLADATCSHGRRSASRTSPLRDVRVTIEHGALHVRGTLHKGVSVPFSMMAAVSAADDGSMRLHAEKLKAVGVPVKGLLDLLGIDVGRPDEDAAGFRHPRRRRRSAARHRRHPAAAAHRRPAAARSRSSASA